MAKVKKDMFSGRYRLVYATPEFATTAISDLKKLNEQVGKWPGETLFSIAANSLILKFSL